MADRSSEPLEIAGLTVTRVEPDAPTSGSILFVHGMWCGAWVWQNYLDFFASRGYVCYALNLRGHCDSRPVPDIGKVSVQDYLADVSDVASTLDRPVLVGHSMGGLLVQKLAEALDPPAVVAITPGAPRGIFALATMKLFRTASRHAGQMLRSRPLYVAKREADWLTLNGLPAHERQRIYDRLVPESGRATLEIALLGLAVDESKVRSPMLVIGAGKDHITPVKVVRKVAKKYRADYREYPEHAHMITLEPRWERVAGDIATWLKRIWNPVAGAEATGAVALK